MKRTTVGFALVALVLGLSGEAASAQMYGFVNYPAVGGVGLKISGDYARGLNDDANKSNYFGGRAELGIPLANFWAGAGSGKPEGDGAESQFGWGGGAAFNLIKGPLVPVKVSIQASYASVSPTGGSISTIPFGVAAALSLGTGGVAVVPWAYAFGEYWTLSPDQGDSQSEFGYGISGGLEVNLPVGLGFYGAVDWSSIDWGEGDLSARVNPLIAAFGVSYKVTIPSLGM